MKKIFSFFILVFLFSFSVEAKINVVTTLPNYAFLVREVGKDLVEVKSMLGTSLDPHFIDAKPTFVALLNKADLLVSNGLDLEVGYLPILIDQARNDKIRVGAPGHLEMGEYVAVMELPVGKISREMGDVHPNGNPHFYLSPGNLIPLAQAVGDKLSQIDPANSEQYKANTIALIGRMNGKLKEWKSLMASKHGSKVITYHKSLVYLLDWLGWELTDTIEPKPGIPPSSSRLVELVGKAKANNVKMVLAEKWYPSKDGKFVAEKAGIKMVPLDGLSDDYLGYFDSLFGQLK